jgi:ABC-type lipoprotein export system ATPase subunit
VNSEVEVGALIACIRPSGSENTPRLNRCMSRRHLGLVWQPMNLMPIPTAFENLEDVLVMVQNRPAGEHRARVFER